MAKRELFDHRGERAADALAATTSRSTAPPARRRSTDGGATTCGQGEVVGIFPEATISRAMELKEFKTGAVRIAAEAGVPLIPVILWGTQRMMTKDHPKDFSRGKTISIRVGAPLHRPAPTRSPRPPRCAPRCRRLLDRDDRGLPPARAAGRLVAARVVRRERAAPWRRPPSWTPRRKRARAERDGPKPQVRVTESLDRLIDRSCRFVDISMLDTLRSACRSGCAGP